jgi:hypothetical protein
MNDETIRKHAAFSWVDAHILLENGEQAEGRKAI